MRSCTSRRDVAEQICDAVSGGRGRWGGQGAQPGDEARRDGSREGSRLHRAARHHKTADRCGQSDQHPRRAPIQPPYLALRCARPHSGLPKGLAMHSTARHPQTNSSPRSRKRGQTRQHAGRDHTHNRLPLAWPTVQKMPNMAHSTAFSTSVSSNTISAAAGRGRKGRRGLTDCMDGDCSKGSPSPPANQAASRPGARPAHAPLPWHNPAHSSRPLPRPRATYPICPPAPSWRGAG